jgi:hypothetical protein
MWRRKIVREENEKIEVERRRGRRKSKPLIYYQMAPQFR